MLFLKAAPTTLHLFSNDSDFRLVHRNDFLVSMSEVWQKISYYLQNVCIHQIQKCERIKSLIISETIILLLLLKMQEFSLSWTNNIRNTLCL